MTHKISSNNGCACRGQSSVSWIQYLRVVIGLTVARSKNTRSWQIQVYTRLVSFILNSRFFLRNEITSADWSCFIDTTLIAEIRTLLTWLTINWGLTILISSTVWYTSTCCSVLSLSSEFQTAINTPVLSFPSLQKTTPVTTVQCTTPRLMEMVIRALSNSRK